MLLLVTFTKKCFMQGRRWVPRPLHFLLRPFHWLLLILLPCHACPVSMCMPQLKIREGRPKSFHCTMERVSAIREGGIKISIASPMLTPGPHVNPWPYSQKNPVLWLCSCLHITALAMSMPPEAAFPQLPDISSAISIGSFTLRMLIIEICSDCLGIFLNFSRFLYGFSFVLDVRIC